MIAAKEPAHRRVDRSGHRSAHRVRTARVCCVNLRFTCPTTRPLTPFAIASSTPGSVSGLRIRSGPDASTSVATRGTSYCSRGVEGIQAKRRVAIAVFSKTHAVPPDGGGPMGAPRRPSCRIGGFWKPRLLPAWCMNSSEISARRYQPGLRPPIATLVRLLAQAIRNHYSSLDVIGISIQQPHE